MRLMKESKGVKILINISLEENNFKHLLDFRKKFKRLHCINIQGNLSEQDIRITRCDNISTVGANNEDMVDSDERSDNLQCRDNSANAKLKSFNGNRANNKI